MQRIKSDLKTGVFSKVYLLYGPETFLIDFYASKIINSNIDTETKDFNFLKISSDIPDEKTVDEFISSYPFMSDKKVLYIRNSGLIKKSTELQKKFWCNLLCDIPDYIIIIWAETDIDKRSGIYKQILKMNCAYEFPFTNEKTLMQWTAKILGDQEKQISVQDVSYLVETCGPSMQNIKNEVDKLVSYKVNSNVITKDDIEAVTVQNTENRIFEMVDDIIAKRSEDAYKKLSDLKILNEEPIKLISIIYKKFLTYKKLYALKNRPIKEICVLTGLYEKYARNDLKQLNSLSEKKINGILDKCMEMDFNIKSGKTDKWLAIDIIISEIIV